MFKSSAYVILLSSILVNYVTFADTDYCDPNLCRKFKNGEYVYSHHIACNNDGSFSSACSSDVALQPITDDLQDLILNLHNDNRNNVSIGDLEGFDTAERMATVHWDDTLAYLAELNCKRCTYGHDQCRNTAQYKHCGQNIGIIDSTSHYKTNVEAISKLLQDWFNEYANTDMSVINSYEDDGNYGHFTQLVSDRAEAIGCALITYSQHKGGHTKYYSYFVCNYSFTNYDKTPIYLAGPTASKCITGANSNYTGLCSPNEVIDTSD